MTVFNNASHWLPFFTGDKMSDQERIRASDAVVSSMKNIGAFDDWSISATAPAGPTPGDLWMDTSSDPAALKKYNGTAWVASSFEETFYRHVSAFRASHIRSINRNVETLMNAGSLQLVSFDRLKYSTFNGTSLVVGEGDEGVWWFQASARFVDDDQSREIEVNIRRNGTGSVRAAGVCSNNNYSPDVHAVCLLNASAGDTINITARHRSAANPDDIRTTFMGMRIG